MNHLHIFTDGSAHTQSKVGYGAYLVVADLATPIELLKDMVKVKRFEQTSSTRLELQTLLWALNETIALTDGGDIVLTVYTDSQNIIGLPGRRIQLEQSNYFSSKNKQLNNYELYQEFYRLNAKLNCRFVKVTGHQPSSQKDEIGKLFSLVDRASRRALRDDC
ncbi:ribonuclease HI [Nitrosomonas sp. Nm33]|uniref:ribonuclease HI n=1 Tax=Nitrosomonas sp. Nm33 TaxID=133724 RepID=UPI00089C85FE|nr:RNase H family protein [Nitrosomonas sp. Nm33]SDY13315.1 RNase H [Nitrosomonas sp. Nm33]